MKQPPLERIFELANFLKVSVSSLIGVNDYPANVPDIEEIIGRKIFDYRFEQAMNVASDAGYFPTKDKDGKILLSIPSEIVHEKDGALSFKDGKNIKIRDTRSFICFVEEALERAVGGDITFNKAFHKFLFGK